MRHAVARLFEALRYRLQCRRFNGSFRLLNPSSRTVAPESSQALTQISTINISSGVKAAGAWGGQPYHLHVSTL